MANEMERSAVQPWTTTGEFKAVLAAASIYSELESASPFIRQRNTSTSRLAIYMRTNILGRLGSRRTVPLTIP
jgi:hypothetical protein